MKNKTDKDIEDIIKLFKLVLENRVMDIIADDVIANQHKWYWDNPTDNGSME